MSNGVIGPIGLAVEPPLAAGERATLIGFVEYFRSVLARKAAGLTGEQLATRLAPSSLSLGALVKHSAFVEDYWFHHVWLGNPECEPWASVDWQASPDWELDSAAGDSPSALIAQYDESVVRSRAALDASPDLDALAVNEAGGGRRVSLRWILVHLIEEYARHCGHADLIRESIDGETGD